MSRYIILEIGNSGHTEFRMKNGDYEATEDAIMLGIVSADSEKEAIDSICEIDYCKERIFDHLIAYRLGD